MKKKLVSFIFSIYCISFFNHLYCQEYTGMIQNIDKTKLDFIDFNVSPLNRRVQLILVKDKPTVDSLLELYNGQRIPANNNYRYEASLYLLSNNLFLVDRYEASKANPYYLCNSFEDFLFIDNNFFIYRNSKDEPPIVQYTLSQEHLKIKDFLSKPNVHFVRHDELTGQDVYKTNDNKFIVTQSVRNSINDKDNPFSVFTNLFVKPEYAKDSSIFIELSMFESFEMMQKSGILESDEEIDADNFKAHSKQIFLPAGSHKINCTVYNSTEGRELFKKNPSVAALPKLSASFKDSKKLKDGEVLIEYSESIYLLFKNEKELDLVINHLKKSVAIEFSNEEVEQLMKETKITLPGNSGSKIWKYLPEFDRKEKSVEDILGIVDTEMNKFFWDNLFIRENFTELLVLAGFVLKEKVGGDWKLIPTLNRPVFQLKSGEEIDIISYFFDEALAQKYSGYCSLEGIVSTLILSSKLKVGRLDSLN